MQILNTIIAKCVNNVTLSENCVTLSYDIGCTFVTLKIIQLIKFK